MPGSVLLAQLLLPDRPDDTAHLLVSGLIIHFHLTQSPQLRPDGTWGPIATMVWLYSFRCMSAWQLCKTSDGNIDGAQGWTAKSVLSCTAAFHHRMASCLA